MTYSHGMISPTVVVSKAEAFCNLPIFLVNKLEGRQSVVVQFRSQEIGQNVQSQYVQWIGGLSTSDEIELPSSQFESPGCRSTVLVEAVLTDIAEAEEVYFVPDSRYDWDIITTQAEVVEEKLLTQLSIGYEGQKIKLQISSSLTVVLKCTGVKIKAAAFAGAHIIDSFSNNGAMSDSSFSDQGESETDGTSVTVARLTSNTLAIVAPYVNTAEPDPMKKDGVNGNIAPSTLANSSVLNLIEVGSVLHPLRTLPQSFRSFDTGHRGKSNTACRQTKFERSRVPLNLSSDSGRTSDANCCFGDENSSRLIEEMLLSTESEETSREFSTDGTISTHMDDVSCIVHPSFLNSAYFTGAKSVQDDSLPSTNVSWCRDESDDNFNLHSNFIGILCLQNSSTDSTTRKGNQGVKPLIDSLIVGVTLSNSVRPLHISLHSSVQKALGALDYSLVRLKVLGTCGQEGVSRFRSPIVPYMMSLQPLVWRSVREDTKHGHSNSQGQGQSSSSGKHATDTLSTQNALEVTSGNDASGEGAKGSSSEGCENTSTVHLDAIRESFVRLFERHHRIKGKFNRDGVRNRITCEKPPLVLGSGSIVTLTHERFDKAVPQDNLDPLKKALNGMKSSKDQVKESCHFRRPVYDRSNGMVTVDYMVHIHKNSSSHENNKIPDKSDAGPGSKSKNKNSDVAVTYDGEYCVMDSHEILFDCLDVMIVEEKKTVLTMAEDPLKGSDSSSQHPFPLPLSVSGPPYHHHQQQLQQQWQQQQCAVFDQQRPHIVLKELLNTNKAAGPVTVDVLSTLLPTAVINSLYTCAPVGSLLVGPRSSGKSLLCQSLAEFLHDSCRVAAHTEYLNCKDLKGRPTQVILDRLTDIFKNAQKYAPSFICLDNLDLICPAQPEGATGVGATQQRLVSLQLECFLADLAFTSTQNYRFASKSIENLYKESCPSLNRFCSSSATIDAVKDSKSHSDRLQNGIDVAVGRVLRGSVYVLATGNFDMRCNLSVLCYTSLNLIRTRTNSDLQLY
jgi:Peroxisome biogenesis factor 1, N-terminal/ATPase family associated with various cellular activities (AAA)